MENVNDTPEMQNKINAIKRAIEKAVKNLHLPVPKKAKWLSIFVGDIHARTRNELLPKLMQTKNTMALYLVPGGAFGFDSRDEVAEYASVLQEVLSEGDVEYTVHVCPTNSAGLDDPKYAVELNVK